MEKEIQQLIDKAGEFIGTDKEFRSLACIDVALDHAINLRKELDRLRKSKKEEANP